MRKAQSMCSQLQFVWKGYSFLFMITRSQDKNRTPWHVARQMRSPLSETSRIISVSWIECNSEDVEDESKRLRDESRDNNKDTQSFQIIRHRSSW